MIRLLSIFGKEISNLVFGKNPNEDKEYLSTWTLIFKINRLSLIIDILFLIPNIWDYRKLYGFMIPKVSHVDIMYGTVSWVMVGFLLPLRG